MFQTREFVFPKTAFIGCIAFKDNTNKKRYVCLTRIFNDIEILRTYVLFVMEDLFKEDPNKSPVYEGYYVECKLSRYFSLNKTHWTNRGVFKKDIFENFRNDVNILKYWKISEILVTPDGEIDGVEFYSFCMSLFKNANKNVIDTFIKNSNHTVDARAKFAAFYSLSRPEKINWLNNIKVKVAKTFKENYIN
jgi:hypothetical protein